jgi:hypothetical protein
MLIHRRFPAVLLVFIVSANACFSSAGENDQADYYPFANGANWQYHTVVNGQPAYMTLRVANVQWLGGRQAAIVESVVNGKVTATEGVGKSAEGIYRININGNVISPPLQVLRYPVKKGDAWSTLTTVNGQPMQANVSVDLEKVTVPAGTFDAAAVTIDAISSEGTCHNKQWMAPGVGIVKQEAQLPGVTITAELTQHDAGK